MGKSIGDYKMMEYENFHGYSSEEISDFVNAEYENFHNKDNEKDYYY